MIEIPVEDLVFVVCTLVGGGLLLITVLVDDVLGGILDALHIGVDLGGVSLMPLVLGFVSMFGVGGLFATQVLDVHGGQAAAIGAIGGAFGFGIVFVLFTILRRSEGGTPFSTRDLVGREAYVGIGIPAGRNGSVFVKAEGQTHEYSATAVSDIPAGSTVRITGTAGTGLIVTQLETATGATPPTAVAPPSGGAVPPTSGGAVPPTGGGAAT